MDVFPFTLVTACQQHSYSLVVLSCCFGSVALISVFLSLSLFFHIHSLFFSTLSFRKLRICEVRVTCVPLCRARGELDAVGWNCSQNTLSLDKLPGRK